MFVILCRAQASECHERDIRVANTAKVPEIIDVQGVCLLRLKLIYELMFFTM